jgi:hypothetical protein
VFSNLPLATFTFAVCISVSLEQGYTMFFAMGHNFFWAGSRTARVKIAINITNTKLPKLLSIFYSTDVPPYPLIQYPRFHLSAVHRGSKKN